MVLVNFVPALLVVSALFAGIKLLYWVRASAMRALALRWDFRYTEGNQKFWSKDRSPFPTSFRLGGFPISRTWNVIEGEKNGIRVLILDSVLNLGVKRGWYTTFIAARTDENPFENKSPKEKIAHSNGWTALYRIRFPELLIPWTLSIQRIEEHLNNLSS